tara:strand:+ start:109 stop:351 length:243 start_codon:yes stop_codon:yes gene_type:complete
MQQNKKNSDVDIDNISCDDIEVSSDDRPVVPKIIHPGQKNNKKFYENENVSSQDLTAEEMAHIRQQLELLQSNNPLPVNS